MVWDNTNLIKVLNANGVAVMPTDTLYGIVARARDEPSVNCIYVLRKRNPQKPCIILIGDVSELEKFSIILSEEQKITLRKYWSFDSVHDFQPGPVSIILDCPDEAFEYLHRGAKTLAFRIPEPRALRDLLIKVGPLVAPSANPEGLPPAENISQAKKYFGDKVDLYLDGGTIAGKASKLIKLHKDGTVSIIRE
jgi:L-threonylcarbamoyladenylate synthase